MRRDDLDVSLKLPLITSPETIVVMEWLTSNLQRYQYWSEQAHQVVLQYGMESAPHRLATMLCEQMTKDLACAPDLGETLLKATFRRVNYFELAVGLLRPYDDSGCFDPQPLAGLAKGANDEVV